MCLQVVQGQHTMEGAGVPITRWAPSLVSPVTLHMCTCEPRLLTGSSWSGACPSQPARLCLPADLVPKSCQEVAFCPSCSSQTASLHGHLSLTQELHNGLLPSGPR